MTNFEAIYASQADMYDELVSHEDYLQNITNALLTIRQFTSSVVVELGAGTGRITRWLSGHAKQLVAFERSAHMLEVLEARRTRPILYAIGDNYALPLPSEFADIAIAGWTFGHAIGWYPEDWRERIEYLHGEMRRVMRPNGR